MEMNWVLGLVIIAIIVGIVVVIVNKNDGHTDSDYRRENELLRGKIVGLEIEIDAWKERGTKAIASRDYFESQCRSLHATFARLVENASEIENLKQLLKRCSWTDKTS